jgi:hypothetical protein
MERNINKIKKLMKDSKIILIGILLLVWVMLMTIAPDFRERKTFEIEDKCGKFVNLISHTIGDESACKTRCRAQCTSINYKYDKAEFEKSDVGCNSCICFCK